jgi:Transposase zinc-binding domain
MHADHDSSTAVRHYVRRQPESTVLYGVVRDHLPALHDRARERSEHGHGYPRFVEREFEKFLACELLRHGFVRVRCDSCAEERLVAFSCKTRGFCPSCTSRRMAGRTAPTTIRLAARSARPARPALSPAKSSIRTLRGFALQELQPVILLECSPPEGVSPP